MVNTVKFSQFPSATIGSATTTIAGLIGGNNAISPWPISWNTAGRPTASNGLLGYNTSLNQYEYYNAALIQWVQLAAGDFPALPLLMSTGGTGANLVPSLAGIIYSTATTMAVLAGTSTANLPLLSGNISAPKWGLFPLSLGGALSTAGTINITGAFPVNAIVTASSTFTLPISGTIIVQQQPNISQPNIIGTLTNDNAAAGSVGEIISSVIPIASPIILVNTVIATVVSITLNTGDYDVWGNISILGASTVGAIGWISNVPLTSPDISLVSTCGATIFNSLTGMTVPQLRFSVPPATTQTLYLTVNANFSGNSYACGGIYARRRR